MKHQIKTLLCICFTMFLGATTSSAQIQLNPLDNFGIFPFGTSFNPAGKFAAMGESGGDCDLYGFRAQVDNNTSMSIGIRLNQYPSVVFSDRFYFMDKSKGTGSCGGLLGYFSSNSFTNTVFTILGSGVALGGTWTPSDNRLKKDVNKIINAKELLQNLRGVTYEYRTDERPELRLNKGLQYGFITQEVKEIMPNAVKTADAPYEGEADFQIMQYAQIIPVITEALKEVIVEQDERLTEQLEINIQLEEKLNQQEKMINTLEDRLKALESRLNNQSTIGMGDEVGTISTEGISLRQNSPNPFQEETVIEYTIPSSMNNAQLVIYDLNGKVISTSNLDAGDGQINIRANGLSSGVYFYNLENNGRILARQKMVIK